MKKLNLFFIFCIFFLALPIAFANDISYDGFENGGWDGGTGWNDVWTVTGAGCEIITGAGPVPDPAAGTYHARGDEACQLDRSFDTSGYSDVTVEFYATAGSLESGEFCYYWYYDGTTYHQLLSLTDGDDDGVHDFYSFNVTQYGVSSSSGFRMTGVTGAGDMCYIDEVNITGIVGGPTLHIYMDETYLTGSTEVLVEGSSSFTNSQHIFELAYPNGTVFCSQNVTSPSVPNTVFSTSCDMPNAQYYNATATILTNDRLYNASTTFDILLAQQDNTIVDIHKVYFSPQVLQGGSTELFAVIDLGENVTLSRVIATVKFPDGTKREIGMSQTVNSGEYRALITDTYQVGITYFTIRAESGAYYDTYTNFYTVAAYNVDFVDTVNRVDQILSQPPHLMVAGTDYYSGEPGKSFFQLSENGQAVNNASCFITIYYPNATIWVEDQLMINAEEHGLQYYPFIAPEKEGIYMIAANCEYYKEDQWYYPFDDIHYPDFEDTTSEYVLGSIRNLNGYQDNLYVETGAIKIGGTYIVDQTFTFNDTIDNHLTNFTNSWLVYSGESTSDNTLDFYWWNWSNSQWVILPNMLTYESQVNPQALEPVETDLYITNELPDEAWLGDVIKIRLYSADNQDFVLFHNWMNIRGDSLVGEVVSFLRGGGEIHISNKADEIINRLDQLLVYANSTKTHTQFITSNIYNLNETGVIATRLTYSDGDFEYAETGANCSLITRGPANNTLLGPVIHNTSMTELGQGTYYYSFIPDYLGIYESEVTCTAGVNETYREYNAITQYRVEDDITDLSISGLSDLIEEMNLAFFNIDSNVTPYTIGGIYTQYLNETVAMIFSGTEYNSGEEGAVNLQVLKSLAAGGNSPITGMTCNSTIYYPDFNGIFESVIMTENTNGIYSHNFTVPSTEGVYIDAVLCNDGSKTYYGMHTFHVAPWANQAFNNSQNLANIYDLLVFVNSTTIEINGTTHNIYNYLQTTIYSILTDINSTLDNLYALNLEINYTVSTLNIDSLQSRLTNIETIVERSEEFTQEQIFLITDSVGIVQGIAQDTYSKEGDIEVALNQVQKNLKRFIELTPESQADSLESPGVTFKDTNIDYGILLVIGVIIGILALSQTNGLIRENKKEKKKTQQQEFVLPSRYRRINYPPNDFERGENLENNNFRQVR